MRFLKGDSRLETARRVLRFFSPFAGMGVVLGTLFLLGGKFTAVAALTAAYAFTPPGRLVLLAAPGLGINPLHLFPPILIFDLMGALFIVWNFYLAEKAPLIGRLIKRTEKTAHSQIKKRKWLSELAWIGVVIFVFLPFMGTNAIVGSIVGKILELNNKLIIAAVMLGSLLGLLGVITPVYLAFEFLF